MRTLRVLFLRLKHLVRAGRIDRDTRDELRAHYDHQIAANIAAGLSPDEARRAATLDIGSIDPLVDASRDARGLARWDALRADLRYALRQIRKRPGFSAAAILTLAIGVGATAAVFAVVDAVVLRPLPYPDADRLYALYEMNTRGNIGRTRATALNYFDWRDQATSFSGMAGHIGTGFTLTGRGDPQFTLGQLVTTNLLDVLQVTPALGRNFQPHEGEAGHHQVAILSHGLWVRLFNADRSVIDSITTINGLPYRIVGVMPPSFAYPSDAYRLMTPLIVKGTVPGAPPINRGSRYLGVIGRLKDDVDPAAASAELEAVSARLSKEYPDANSTVSARMISLTEQTVGNANTNLVVVLVAVGFVLLVACVNVAGLSIARGQARTRELAVRTAIGASRGRLIAQLATEGLVLFAIGGGLGLALAAWSVSALAASLPASIPRTHEIAIDARFFLIAGGATLLTGLLASVFPAWQVARRGPAAHLAWAGGRGTVSATRSTNRARAALIVAQIAAAVVLVTGAALALRSFQHVNAVDNGFSPVNTMTFSVVLREHRYPQTTDMRTFLDRVNAALSASVPGAIEAAGTTTHLPLAQNNFENTVTVDGVATPAGSDPPIAAVRGVTGQYRVAVGARLLEGRDFTPADDTGEPVAIVTADFARRYIAPRPALGARLKMDGGGSDDPWKTVVGVFADVRHAGPERDARPEVWMPLAHMNPDLLSRWFRGVSVVTRTSVDPETTVPALRGAMRELDPELPLVDVRSLETLARSTTAERRLQTSLLAAFAAIALTLAAVGIFGVLGFYVAQHMQEFGVRLALGATPSGLLSLVMRRGAVLLAIGFAVGLPAAVLVGRGMESILFGVEPIDLASLAAAVVLLTSVTAAACLIPARRAMRTDPVRVLRLD
jgi:putative ABC transport system permease protein